MSVSRGDVLTEGHSMRRRALTKAFIRSFGPDHSFTHIDDVGKLYHLMQQIQKETP